MMFANLRADVGTIAKLVRLGDMIYRDAEARPLSQSVLSRATSEPEGPLMMTTETKSATDILQDAVRLPCGATIPNRIAKAAMSEQLADRYGLPTSSLENLYRVWGKSGAGLLITGNAMIDRRALTEPRNAILEDDRGLRAFDRWAETAKQGGARVFLQISHPGRVAVAPLLRRPVGPSAVALDLPGMALRRPRALTVAEIQDLIARFARTALLAVRAGFDGVQIHAAHGYLLSQFLSPIANVRADAYGGDADRRRRLLLEVVRAVRAAIGPTVPIAVKLNSADFQKGGLEVEESLQVARALEGEGIDLLEISGGNYEAPVMTGVVAASTRDREAYFLRYAEQVRGHTKLPLMLTGGIRSSDFMRSVVKGRAVDIVGLARPFALMPDLPARIFAGTAPSDFSVAPRLGYGPIDAYLVLAWHAALFRRISGGEVPKPRATAIPTLLRAGTTIFLRALTQASCASGRLSHID